MQPTLTTSSRGLAAARPMAMIGSFGSFSSMRNTEVSTECRLPLSSSTRSEVPAGTRQAGRPGREGRGGEGRGEGKPLGAASVASTRAGSAGLKDQHGCCWRATSRLVILNGSTRAAACPHCSGRRAIPAGNCHATDGARHTAPG